MQNKEVLQAAKVHRGSGKATAFKMLVNMVDEHNKLQK